MTVDHDYAPDDHEDGPPADDLDLVMPFVSVESKGGPHDDDSYVCGWEMGALDSELAHREQPLLERVIHETNTGQADLVAMRYGYTVTITPRGDGWAFLRLTAAGKAP